MIHYIINLPGMPSPVKGMYNGDKIEARKHVESLEKSWLERIKRRDNEIQKIKTALSGPNVMRGL